MTEISERLQAAHASIAHAAERSGRTDQPALVAVTKTVPSDRIAAAYEAGQRLFGENRVQETQEKWTTLREQLADASLHLIGHLQTNKARVAPELFDLVESVDSLRIARELDRRAAAGGRRLPVLFEVNVAGEASKSGFHPSELREAMDHLLSLEHLEPRGLMTVAPNSEDRDVVRNVFAELRRMRDDLRAKYDLEAFSELSMGMSGDYELAIEEGATMVRLGRAIFGERPPIPGANR